MTQRCSTELQPEFDRALASLLARVFHSETERAVAVAFSGGLDSTVLLDLVHDYALRHSIRLFAFHVHHGISTQADAWLEHCRQAAAAYGVQFDSRAVRLDKAKGDGMEAQARQLRYSALADMCAGHGVTALLTAQHEDDQAETLLLQLLRGAGVAGLAGMPPVGPLPAVASGEAEGISLIRPLLGFSRVQLEAWAAFKMLPFVEDDSNSDPHYARNAIRLKVAPVLDVFFPGYASRLSRSARHLQSANELMQALAAIDYESCRDGQALNAGVFCALSLPRQENLLRFWLMGNGAQVPSTVRLNELLRQISTARPDRQPVIETDGLQVRRHGSRLFLLHGEKAGSMVKGTAAGTAFKWQGENRISTAFPAGELCFESTECGLDPAWLRQQTLHVRPYLGQARFKVQVDRPRQRLKHLCQARQMPPWERQQLPLLYAGETLVFVPGFGLSADLVSVGYDRISLGWIPSAGNLS